MYRAPFGKILPAFAPVILERGVPGYFASQLISGERRLLESELRPLLISSAFIGTEAMAVDKQFDRARVLLSLANSIQSLHDISSDEQKFSLKLVKIFSDFPIIRADHPFDDWVCEALWGALQTTDYAYPSAMSGAVAFGLSIIHSLQQCTLEYDGT